MKHVVLFSWRHVVLNLQCDLRFGFFMLEKKILGCVSKNQELSDLAMAKLLVFFLKFRFKDRLRFQKSNLKNCKPWQYPVFHVLEYQIYNHGTQPMTFCVFNTISNLVNACVMVRHVFQS